MIKKTEESPKIYTANESSQSRYHARNILFSNLSLNDHWLREKAFLKYINLEQVKQETGKHVLKITNSKNETCFLFIEDGAVVTSICNPIVLLQDSTIYDVEEKNLNENKYLAEYVTHKVLNSFQDIRDIPVILPTIVRFLEFAQLHLHCSVNRSFSESWLKTNRFCFFSGKLLKNHGEFCKGESKAEDFYTKFISGATRNYPGTLGRVTFNSCTKFRVNKSFKPLANYIEELDELADSLIVYVTDCQQALRSKEEAEVPHRIRRIDNDLKKLIEINFNKLIKNNVVSMFIGYECLALQNTIEYYKKYRSATIDVSKLEAFLLKKKYEINQQTLVFHLNKIQDLCIQLADKHRLAIVESGFSKDLDEYFSADLKTGETASCGIDDFQQGCFDSFNWEDTKLYYLKT